MDRALNAPDQEIFKTTAKVPSKIFVPQAPEIADIKKDKLSIQPDPFNAAAVLNTGGEIASKKSLNLFQRVTGIGKRGKELTNKPGKDMMSRITSLKIRIMDYLMIQLQRTIRPKG